MRVLHSLEEAGRTAQPSVVTIGNFDGVHRGHQMVLGEVIARAKALQARSIAVTFEPHPLRVLKPELEVKLITPLAQKLELLAATGLDATLVLPFTREFSNWSAHDFAELVLRDALSAVEVHEGENFRFGHGAAGDMRSLSDFGHKLGFAVHPSRPYCLRGDEVSSTRVRNVIAEGRMSQARALLGRPFAVRGTPASGRGYGTRYTVPTINLAPYSDLLPANGVYITTLRIGEGSNARIFNGVTNAGNRPTFGADSFAVESYLFDFEPMELTEETTLELTFLKRLRGEVRFASPDALRAQIERDVSRARRFFSLQQACTQGVPFA